ncbi:MAG: Holliday junction resolvase RuvX [Patescibacteria group bacterium]
MSSKLLGIDYGTKRVGVALSDESASVAFAKGVFPSDRSLIPTLAELIKKEGVETVVIGESKDKDGNDNAIMKAVRKFVSELERTIHVRVLYEPEFYSSVEARRDSDDKFVDAKAAAIILNSFIERNQK